MNTNCLEGIRCPKCGQEDEFLIYASSWFQFTDDGTGDFGDVEYDNTAPIECRDCGEIAIVADFTAKEGA